MAYLKKVVKYGNFKLKNGNKSNLYVDFRSIISNPQMMKYLVEDVWDQIQNFEFDYVCGVPEACVPLASCVSFKYKIPQIMLRKVQKSHGTHNLIEGDYEKGKSCLLIEDVISTGSSLKESIKKLTNEGKSVKYIIVLIDRFCEFGSGK